MEPNLSHGSQIEASHAGAQVPSSGVEPPPKPSPLNCPVCGVPMVPSKRWGCRIETCAEHGIWLDKDDVRQRFGRVLRANVPFPILCGLQILGVSGAVIAAAINIESIVVTGPVFSVLGVLVALGSRASRSVFNAIFGLSAIAMSLSCLIWIAALSWSPGDAQKPVTTALICYETLLLPVGLLALYRTLVPRVAAVTADVRFWQFNIRHLLTTTFVVAVMLAVGKLGFEHGDNVRLGIAVGLSAGSVIGIGFALYFGITRRHSASWAERSG
jgi:hypothetical protein